MKQIDARDESLNELAQAIDESLAPDRPAAWPPAFAASDGKQKETLVEELAAQTADASAATPADEGDPQVASAGGFLSFVKGWLGRA